MNVLRFADLRFLGRPAQKKVQSEYSGSLKTSESTLPPGLKECPGRWSKTRHVYQLCAGRHNILAKQWTSMQKLVAIAGGHSQSTEIRLSILSMKVAPQWKGEWMFTAAKQNFVGCSWVHSTTNMVEDRRLLCLCWAP